MIDASNKTGSMEFACGGNADDFFPVRVSFYSKKSYSEIQVCMYTIRGMVKKGWPRLRDSMSFPLWPRGEFT